MRVAVDAMGGDNAPVVEVEGAVAASTEYGIPITLVGDTARLRLELEKFDSHGLDIILCHADDVVGMHDSASDAIRKKKDSSIRVAFELVRDGHANAVVSAGNSGATMAVGMFLLKRLQGIDRPAIAQIFPTLRGTTLVLDVGGNVDCKPVNLVQFAIMGDVYARYVMSCDHPRIGLLSNGEEDGKGNELTRETSAMLKNTSLKYVGYVEGGDIFSDDVDVVVCDGFVGNVALKLSEGLAEAIGNMLKSEIQRSLISKLGYLLARKSFISFKKKIDYAEYGGAPLLGINGVGMICHGGSSSKAIKNAIRFACEYAEKDVNNRLAEELQENFMAYTNQPESLNEQAAG